ncbi:helix-turn-helix domain-containing protein [Azorhizobium sp. AG788]|uniref:helix-turn-helix domain-containing protein n=1 Tax=Azorhizobium caulinodans TaxID=7 RepID=UPI001FDFBB31
MGADAGEKGSNCTGGTVVEISQDDLASMANLSRSTAGRVLDSFEACSLIKRSYRTLSILDLEGLKRRRT